MRLGQLARKLQTTIPEIVDYLADKGIMLSGHPNDKLDQDVEETVILAFAEDSSVSMTTDPVETKEIVESEENKEQAHNEEDPFNFETLVEEAFQDKEDEPIEVIKAPKIELQGLKVLGKIELATSREISSTGESSIEKEVESGKAKSKKSPAVQPKETPEEREARRIRSKKARIRREEEELARKRERELRLLKKRKEQFYQKRIQKQPASVKREKKKPQAASAPVTPLPQSILGKIWRWLNT